MTTFSNNICGIKTWQKAIALFTLLVFLPEQALWAKDFDLKRTTNNIKSSVYSSNTIKSISSTVRNISDQISQYNSLQTIAKPVILAFNSVATPVMERYTEWGKTANTAAVVTKTMVQFGVSNLTQFTPQNLNLSVPITIYNYLFNPNTEKNFSDSVTATNNLKEDFALTLIKRPYDFASWVDNFTGLNLNWGTKLYQNQGWAQSISDSYQNSKNNTEYFLKQAYGQECYNKTIRPAEEFISDNAIITAATLGVGSLYNFTLTTSARILATGAIGGTVIGGLSTTTGTYWLEKRKPTSDELVRGMISGERFGIALAPVNIIAGSTLAALGYTNLAKYLIPANDVTRIGGSTAAIRITETGNQMALFKSWYINPKATSELLGQSIAANNAARLLISGAMHVSLANAGSYILNKQLLSLEQNIGIFATAGALKYANLIFVPQITSSLQPWIANSFTKTFLANLASNTLNIAPLFMQANIDVANILAGNIHKNAQDISYASLFAYPALNGLKDSLSLSVFITGLGALGGGSVAGFLQTHKTLNRLLSAKSNWSYISWPVIAAGNYAFLNPLTIPSQKSYMDKLLSSENLEGALDAGTWVLMARMFASDLEPMKYATARGGYGYTFDAKQTHEVKQLAARHGIIIGTGAGTQISKEFILNYLSKAIFRQVRNTNYERLLLAGIKGGLQAEVAAFAVGPHGLVNAVTKTHDNYYSLTSEPTTVDILGQQLKLALTGGERLALESAKGAASWVTIGPLFEISSAIWQDILHWQQPGEKKLSLLTVDDLKLSAIKSILTGLYMHPITGIFSRPIQDSFSDVTRHPQAYPGFLTKIAGMASPDTTSLVISKLESSVVGRLLLKADAAVFMSALVNGISESITTLDIRNKAITGSNLFSSLENKLISWGLFYSLPNIRNPAVELYKLKAAVSELTEAKIEKLTKEVATELHDKWKSDFKEKNGPAAERWKPAKDPAWEQKITEELGLQPDKQVGNIHMTKEGKVEIDIANMEYGELTQAWKAENKAAGNDGVNTLINALKNNIPEAELLAALTDAKAYFNSGNRLDASFTQDSKARNFLLIAGDQIHQSWLSRNGQWAPEEQKAPFKDLDAHNQKLDINLLEIVLNARIKP